MRLLLTEEELKRIDQALVESGALNRSLLILEAIQAGIANAALLRTVEGRRRWRVDFRIPRELKDKVQTVARRRHQTQQSLLRHLLFHYISRGPWLKSDSLEPADLRKVKRRRVP